MLLFWYLHDDEEAIKCIQKILKYDPENISAIMILVYIENYSHCNYDEKLFEKLCSLQSQDDAIKSLIEYVKSWYYDDEKNENLYKQSLLNSISLSNQFVRNFSDLGRYYCKKKMYHEAKYYLSQAIKNVQLVYGKDEPKDPLDPQEFFNEGLKGIHLSYVNYDSIVELYNSLP